MELECPLIDSWLLIVCNLIGIVKSETLPVLPPTAFSKSKMHSFTLEPCLVATCLYNLGLSSLTLSNKKGVRLLILIYISEEK